MTTMTPELFVGTAEMLFGSHWQQPTARQLGFSERTLRRWATGQTKIPPSAVLALLKAVRTHYDALERVRTELNLIWLDIQKEQRYATPPQKVISPRF